MVDMKHISKISFALTALVAIVLTVLNIFNLYIFDFSIEKVILILLCLLCISFVTQHFTNEKAWKNLELSVKSIKQIPENNLVFFDDSVEIESALATAVLRAKKSVCDLTWKNVISSGFDSNKRKTSHLNLETNITKAASNILYREIFIFNDPRRIRKLRRRLAENMDGYSCKFFKKDNIIPRLQFVIVDDEQIFFFASSANSPLCLIKDSRVCKVFVTYFEELWSKATFIKDGATVFQKEVDYIEKTLKKY
tara:strand:- start:1599 stop:2354 length:756 start_codon:yes stop_codon:yes gene_type:complete